MGLIADLERLEKEATPAPWFLEQWGLTVAPYAVATGDPDAREILIASREGIPTIGNTNLIVHLRNRLPVIIAVLRASLKVAKRAKEKFYDSDDTSELIDYAKELREALTRAGEE